MLVKSSWSGEWEGRRALSLRLLMGGLPPFVESPGLSTVSGGEDIRRRWRSACVRCTGARGGEAWKAGRADGEAGKAGRADGEAGKAGRADGEARKAGGAGGDARKAGRADAADVKSVELNIVLRL